jgi:aryl-phospho-beta-D-glucosidase BglC (GH1 family)
VNPFDCYIDDVHFLSEAAPTVPSATVTWTTSNNKLNRNGSAYRIKGLDRPSMEWDCAGFSITREDIKRMKAWKANTVRLAVMDTLWNGATTGGSTCNGDAYKRQVKRVINWILEEGMDAILDLHRIDGVPGSAHTAFWTSITQDAFFKDTRIIFELYNEPNGDINGIRSWMQSTVDLIRNANYTNLILVAGTDWTFDISTYETNPITGAKAQPIAYVAHPYDIKPGGSGAWDGKFGNVAKKYPVVATEFGQTDVSGGPATPTQKTCDASFYNQLLTYFADSTRSMGYTGWAWYVDHYNGTVNAESTCGFPQLIVDYSATTNSAGAAVKTDMAK